MIVKSIATLNKLHDDQITSINKQLTSTQDEHPNKNLSDFQSPNHPVIIDSINPIGICSDCGHPEFKVLNKNGEMVGLCKDAINAVRMDSLKHKPANSSTDICFDCRIKKDAFGFVVGADHIGRNINDVIGIDKTIPGLISLVALGKVEQDAQGNIIIN